MKRQNTKSNEREGKGDKIDKCPSKPNKGKGGRREAEVLDTLVRAYRSQGNPVSFYNKYPQYFKDAGTVPFADPVGAKVDIRNVPNTNVRGRQFFVPGIMALEYIPGIGYSCDNTSPINRASQAMTTWMKATQKFTSAFDKADVMMAFMALDSCYILYEMGKRAYGASNLTSPVNRWIPNTLSTALGIQYDSIVSDPAKFRARLNKFAIDLGQFCVPKELDITARHMWMTRGLYWDADNVMSKAQLYAFVPRGVWKYDNTVSTGSQLTWVPFPLSGNGTVGMTAEQFFQICNDCLTAISGDDDIVQICALFFNAFGREAMRQLEEVPDLYTVFPVYDRLVLSQIENCTIIGDFAAGYTPVISQDPSVNNGAILYQPRFLINGLKPSTAKTAVPFSNAVLYDTKRILNWHGTQPSPDEVIEMTRLTVGVKSGEIDSNGTFAPTAFGADTLAAGVVYHYPVNATTPADWPTGWTETNVFFHDMVLNGDSDFGWQTRALNTVMNVAAFDWAPKIEVYLCSGTTAENMQYVRCGALQDYSNYAVLDADKIATMHDAAMLSLFDLPQMGFTIKG